MKKLIFLVILSFALDSVAQNAFSPGAWKRYRKEIQFSIGPSNMMSDLGGRDAIGTNFLRDFEFNQTRINSRASFAYFLNPFIAYRSTLNMGLLSASDTKTNEPFRNNRNLSARTTLVEFNQNIQFVFKREKMGSKYGLKSLKGSKFMKAFRALGWYATAGIGVFYYNPRALYNGKMVSLHGLHTEGQGLPGGPEQYKRIAIDIPLGFGMRKAFSRTWGMYIEFTQHYTFTDYLDDVSTVYYDNDALLANYGAASAAMADPNLGNFIDANGNSFTTAAGEQRGDPKDKDNYMLLTFGAYHKITKKNNKGKYRKVKALF